MAFWSANRLQKQAGSVPAAFTWDPTALTARSSVLQWTIAGLVGIILGIFTIAIFSLPPQWAPLLILAVLCPFIAMIVGNVHRLLLGVIILDIPFPLDIHLDYRTEAAALGALGGLNISLTTVSIVILYALWMGRLLARVGPQSRPLLRTSLPLALYLVFAALSVVVARDVALATYDVFLLLQMFLLYVYVASSVRTRQDVLFIVTVLLVGLVLESLVMIGLRYGGQIFSLGGISGRIDVGTRTAGEISRVGGTIGAPNTVASYLSFLLVPATSVLLTPLGQRYKRLAVLACGLGGVALILTLSRGGWVAFALSITILCLLAWRRGWLSPMAPLTMAVVIALLCLLYQDAILTRLFGDDRGAAYSRIPLMRLAFRVIMDNPVLGVGANNFAVIIRQYATPEFSGEWLYAVHNKYLLVWAETGIGALVAFISFLVVTIRRGWQCWKLHDRLLSPLALAFTAAIIGHMAHMLAEVFNHRPQVQLLWVIAGLIAALHNIAGDS